MGWEIGWDSNWKRDIGYGVPAECDHPKCKERINRGLSHVCGSEPYGGDHGCGLHFCAAHLSVCGKRDGACVSLCPKCANYKRTAYKPKPDLPEWTQHKATHPSWEEWRHGQAKKGGRDMKPAIEILLCAAAVLAFSFNGCRAEAAEPTAEARQALAVLCPSRVSLSPVFARAAVRYRLPAGLLVSQARNETGCTPDAVSANGIDAGILQVRVGTHAARGRTVEQLKNPEVNVPLAARHLRRCLDLCHDYAGALGVYAGWRTCAKGRASGYSRRVLGFWEITKGEPRS
jgi:hypothetical protein